MQFNRLGSAVRIAALVLALACAATVCTHVALSSSKAGPALPAVSADIASIRQLGLAANDLVVDPNTQTIYASLAGDREGGNSIVAIDPTSGAVGAPVFVGSHPGEMAISDDGQFVYVMLEGAGAVRRFDVATQTAGPQFTLGNDFSDGPFFGFSLSVAPGSPGTFAVFRLARVAGFSGNVAVFDNGVQRGATFPLPVNGASVAFGATASRLYSYDPLDSRLTRLAVGPAGLASEGSFTFPTGFTTGTIKFDGGLVYTSSAKVVNPETGTVVGSFAGPCNGDFAIDSKAGRAYCLTGSSVINNATLRAYDLKTFQEVGSVEIPGAPGTAKSIVRWGSNGLAVLTPDGKLFIIQTTLVPSPDPVPSITPTPTPSPTPTPTPHALFVRQVVLPSRDIAYSPATGLIYAAVPSSAGPQGNSVTAVDPSTATVGASAFVGSEPGQMSVSQDGQHIYVALTGATAVRRFDLASHTAGPQLTLINETTHVGDGAWDMAPVPGSPLSVAVSASTVSVYDDVTRRPKTASGGFNPSTLEFSDSPSRLYGARSNSSGYDLRKFTVDATGITREETFRNRLGSGDIAHERGRLFAGSQIFDPEAGTLVASFRLIENPSSPSALRCDGAYLPDPENERVYYLCYDNGIGGLISPRARIKAFDLRTFLPLGIITVEGVTGVPGRLVRWGKNGLAFRTDAGRIYLVQTTLVSQAEAVPAPTPTTTPTPVTPTPNPTPGPGELRQIPLTTKHLVVDPATQTIFASVPSSAGAGGNSITPIDPVAGTAGQPVPVGSEPGRMAISDNGQYVYVVLDGASAVRRFDVATRTAGLQFPLGTDPQFGPYGASDIAVAPGQPGTVAVARTRPVSPQHGGVAIFDEGVQRPVTTPPHTGSNRIEYSASPSVLYGQNIETTEFGFRRMAVASCGVSTASVIQHPYLASDFRVAGGLAYTVGGHVYNPEDGTRPGTFVGGGGPVVPDVQAGRVYFIQTGGGPFATLRVFDMNTFLQLGALQIPGLSSTEVATSLVRWGAHGLAFNTGAKVYLLENALIGGTGTAPTLPVPPTPTFTARGGVLAFGGGSPDGITLDVTGAVTATLTTDADGNFSLGGIPPCAAPFTITPSKPDYVFIPASLTVTDLSSVNNLFFNAVFKSVGFTRTTLGVPEGAGKAQVVVTRPADTSQAATVSYETASGTASDRSDFNTIIGSLSFAPGEASKTLTVLLNDDAFVEGPETFTVTLKGPSGVHLNPFASTITVTIIDNDAQPSATNPLDGSSFFVRQHYHDFFSREPDAPGLAHWTNVIDSCGSDAQCREVNRINVSGAFFLSIEFTDTGYLVERAYKAAYGDAVGTSTLGGTPHTLAVPVIRLEEFIPDTQRIGRGVVVLAPGWEALLESNKQAYFLEFVQRPRFTTAFPAAMTPAEFVGQLNARAGNPLDATERQNLIDELTNNNTTAGRASVLRKVAEDSTLADAEKNRAFVLMQYFGYLRRDPNGGQDTDHTGYDFWLGNLNHFNGNFVRAELVKAFISSDEYRKRFGQ